MPDSSSSGGNHDASLAAAVRVLSRGGIVVYPTETLYALGADAFNPAALQRLVALKARQNGKPIAVLIGDVQMVRAVAAEIPFRAEILIRRFWPGPLTLVLRARPTVSSWLTGGGDGIGVRLSSHPLATGLVRALGRPLTAPSANPAGKRPPSRVEDARAYFGSRVDHYVDGGALAGEPASTVVDVREGWKVLRAGAVSADDVRSSLRGAV